MFVDDGMLLQMKIIPPFDPTRILPLQELLVADFKQDRFQDCASGAQT